MREQTRREAKHALTFGGKFLAWSAAALLALWTIGFAFQFSRWTGYLAVGILVVVLYATAHVWIRWQASLLIFAIVNSLLVLQTHRGLNNPSPVSTGAALLMLLYFSVGYAIFNWYGEERITPLDRCASIVYSGSIIWVAAWDPHGGKEPIVVTGGVLYPLVVGMAAIVISFAVHRVRRASS